MSTKLRDLPVECLEHILSLTSPEDTVRSALVSKHLFSVAISDEPWKKFLPSDYVQIMNSSPRRFDSLKDLFVLLYRSHLLIDQNRKSISLERWGRKKCYMLGSRSLSIIQGDTPAYWDWISVPESRFPENAKLEAGCWLDIKGEIPTKSLSPNTTYGAYFVYKLTRMKYTLTRSNYTGFEHTPVKVSISEVDENGHHLRPVVTNSVYLMAQERLNEGVPNPVERGDGWLEIQMGKFYVGDEDDEDGVVLEMSVTETEILNWKHDLLIQGIQLRPLH